ncbi:MAG: glycosyltransferase family 4 protein [Verrucomicrobiota bacterium]|nr:glycosyltransferase family 4 protein [Verrucomicrobiota bacterium]
MQSVMRIGFLVPDNRDEEQAYELREPVFGTAAGSVIKGLRSCPDVEVHVLCCVRKPLESPLTLAPNIFYHSELVPKIGWGRTLYSGCVRAIRRKLKEIEPDVVHGQGTERYCALGAAFSGFPNVVTIHGNMREIARKAGKRADLYLRLTAFLEWVALRKTGGVFCNSAYTQSLVEPVARKTWHVPNPLQERYLASIPAHSRESRPTILYVGTIVDYKRQLESLQMFEQLAQRTRQFHVQFIGGRSKDPYADRFFERLEKLKPLGIASHRGHVDAEELVALFDQSSALAHFSIEESFGLVVAEALARNLKVFCSRAGGLPDIAKDVAGAELYDSQDWLGMVDGIERWIKNGWPRPKGAAEVMKSRYEPRIIAARHVEIYQEIALKR